MATSGTVAQYSFPQRKVLDHAFRRAGYLPEQATAEWIEVAQDLLFLQLSEYVNAGFPLWTRQFGLLGIAIGSPETTCPAGTVDVLHCYWRILNPWRGAATLSTGTDGSTLFGGQPNADVAIAGPNPGVSVNFGSATELDTVGVLLGGSQSITTALQVQTSTDGATWTTAQTLPSATYSPGAWTYFDLDPSITAQYVKLVYPANATWTLNQLNFGLANGEDIEIGPLNIDDYYNLPDKQYQDSQCLSGYVDRQTAAPVIKLWPVPNATAFYNGTVAVLSRRYIQDPGAMTNDLEIPARWLEAVTARLGVRLMDELPDPAKDAQSSYFGLMSKVQRRQILEQNATKAEALLWSEERVRAPIRWAPRISPYTR